MPLAYVHNKRVRIDYNNSWFTIKKTRHKSKKKEPKLKDPINLEIGAFHCSSQTT